MTRAEKIERFRKYAEETTSSISDPDHHRIAALAFAYGYLVSTLTDEQVDKLPGGTDEN